MAREVAIKFAELAKEYHKIRSNRVAITDISIDNMELIFNKTLIEEEYQTKLRSVLYANFTTGEIVWCSKQNIYSKFTNFKETPREFLSANLHRP